jgi:hypothetical protein
VVVAAVADPVSVLALELERTADNHIMEMVVIHCCFGILREDRVAAEVG